MKPPRAKVRRRDHGGEQDSGSGRFYNPSMLRPFFIALLLVCAIQATVRPSQMHVMAPLDSFTWRDGVNGVSTAITEGDPGKPGPFTMMLKLADGAWIQPHWHNVDKRHYVIKGKLLMGMGERADATSAQPLAAGAVAVVPANTRHFEGGRGETIVALSAVGPFQTTFVNAPGTRAPAQTTPLPAPASPAAATPQAPPGPPAPATRPAPACDAAEHRQFDFWIGEWDVTAPNGRLAGRNFITRELNGCVIHERWAGAGGMRGESFNIWDRTRKRWHQTWVSDQGALLVLEGAFVNGAMQLSGESTTPKGVVANRITWTPAADGSVRQHWEISRDGGKTWQTAFDGTYRRARTP
ncbi:MAG: cupin domain-containing protein [Vicinamibacterales bacterium]